MTLTAKTLASALKPVVAIVEARNTIPILSQVLLRCDGETLRLTSTDLDSEITVAISLDDPDAWPAFEGTAPAAALLTSIRKLAPDCDVILRPRDGRMVLFAGRNRVDLPTMNVGDFPCMVEGEAAGCVQVVAAALVDELKAVAPCMGKDEERAAYMAGAFVHMREAGPRLVAMDGKRLAFRDLQATVTGAPPSAIIPRKAVLWLTKHLPVDGLATLEVTDSKVTVRHADLTFSTKLVDSTFPDYTRAIPDGSEPCAVVDAGVLRQGADLVCACSSEGPAKRKVTIMAREGEVVLTCRDPFTNADGETVLESAVDDGADLSILLSMSQLTGALAGFGKAEMVELRQKGNVFDLRSAGDASRGLVIMAFNDEGAEHMVDVPALERPAVTLTMPKHHDDEFTVETEVRRTIRASDAERRTYTFATYAAAARVALRLEASLRRTCDLTVIRDHYTVWDVNRGGRASQALTGAERVYWFTTAEVVARTERVSRLQSAIGVFDVTADDSVPWTREVFDRPEANRYPVHPAAGGPTKAIQAYAERVVRKATGAAAPPKAPPAPIDARQVERVARMLGYGWTDRPGVRALMEAEKVRTYAGFLKRLPYPVDQDALQARVEAFEGVGEPDTPPEVVEAVQATPQPLERVRIWARETTVAGIEGFAWGLEGQACVSASCSGFIAREGAVAHAIALHPGRRIVLTAGGPPAAVALPPNVMPFRIPARLAGASVATMARAVRA